MENFKHIKVVVKDMCDECTKSLEVDDDAVYIEIPMRTEKYSNMNLICLNCFNKLNS